MRENINKSIEIVPKSNLLYNFLILIVYNNHYGKYKHMHNVLKLNGPTAKLILFLQHIFTLYTLTSGNDILQMFFFTNCDI